MKIQTASPQSGAFHNIATPITNLRVCPPIQDGTKTSPVVVGVETRGVSKGPSSFQPREENIRPPIGPGLTKTWQT